MEVITQIVAKLSKQQVLTDSDSLTTYGKDWSNAGKPAPLAIVFPESTEQVQALVRLANQVPFSLVPSGGRTGLSGGAMATNQEVVVSFEKMNKVLDFNTSVRLSILDLKLLINSRFIRFWLAQGYVY